MLWRHLGRSWNTVLQNRASLPPMTATNSPETTRRLAALIHHLRRHTSPSPGKEEATSSQVGPFSSAIPSAEIPKLQRAAVLICLFEGRAGDLRVILTKRSPHLSTHSGEVSLPGGKAEEGDVDDAATALREAREEIGLEPSIVTVVSVLEPILSKRFLLRVVPVVGILADRQAFKPIANTDEVEAIFDAPLEMFLKDEDRSSKESEWNGIKYLLHYFTYESENGKFIIWGLTAAILIRAASMVYQRPPSFLEQIQ